MPTYAPTGTCVYPFYHSTINTAACCKVALNMRFCSCRFPAPWKLLPVSRWEARAAKRWKVFCLSLTSVCGGSSFVSDRATATSVFFFFYHLIQNQVGKGLNHISEENFFHQTQQKVKLSAHTATLPGGGSKRNKWKSTLRKSMTSASSTPALVHCLSFISFSTISG